MTKNSKAVVLLSGGLDSTVNLYAAVREFDVVLALTVDYGQRAAAKEIEFSKKTCAQLGVKQKILDLTWFKDITKTSLVNKDSEVPVGDEVKIDDMSMSSDSAKAVWVPNRNGILLNVAAGFAESFGAQFIIPGFNKEEAATFPDNSKEFLVAVTESLNHSTANHVETFCFTTELNKSEIVQMGSELEVNFDNVWSCYFSGDERCGECESCQRFFRAMES